MTTGPGSCWPGACRVITQPSDLRNEYGAFRSTVTAAFLLLTTKTPHDAIGLPSRARKT